MHACLEEIREKLLGGKIEKIYQPEKEEIILLIRRERLLINVSNEAARICLSYAKKENPPQAPMFCMLLRKSLTGAKLVDVIQPQNDRSCTLVFEAYNEMGDVVERCLRIEIMGRCSNVIFTEGDKIIDSAKREDFAQSDKRQILPGLRYEEPPAQDKRAISDIDTEKFVSEITSNDTPVGRALMNGISGLSPLWSREICFLAGDVYDTPGTLLESGEKLKAVLDGFKNKITAGDFTPVMISPENSKGDYSFLPVRMYGDCVTEYATLGELTDAFYANRNAAEYVKQRGTDIMKLVNSQIERISRKLNLLKGEKEENEGRDVYKVYGELITANIYAIKKGQRSLKAVDYYSEPPKETEIPLDTRLTPAENAQKYFKIYRKSRTALTHIDEESEKAKLELEYMHSVADALSRASTTAALSEIREELERGGYVKKRTGAKKTVKRRYQRFMSDGFEILAGSNNLQNDELTFRTASRQDLWFHIKDAPGSHVILRTEGETPTDRAITDAGIIAATLSSGAQGAKIPVDYTRVCFVKKIHGAPLGLVTYTDQTTILAVPSKERCSELEIK